MATSVWAAHCVWRCIRAVLRGGNPDSNVELYRGGPPPASKFTFSTPATSKGISSFNASDATPEVLAQPINKSNGLKNEKVSGFITS